MPVYQRKGSDPDAKMKKLAALLITGAVALQNPYVSTETKQGTIEDLALLLTSVARKPEKGSV